MAGTLIQRHLIRKQAVTESNKLTCPECNTPNAVDAPFCENCGFRLRRAPTALEGHAAVTRAQQKRGKLAPAPTEIEFPALDPAALRATVPEGVPSVKSQRIKLDEKSSTVLEGLAPIISPAEDISSIHPPTRELPSYTSGIHAVPDDERQSSAAMMALAWIVSTGALMLITYFVAREEPDEVVLKADGGPVAVAAGSYVKGLSEQVRAFILMTCTRVAEDRNTCDEQKLLAGEFPQETIELPAYRIDSQEVTNGDWAACVDAGKCAEPSLRDCKVYTNQGLQVSMRVPKPLLEDAVPVVCVTRAEAADYCAFAGGALPTADQWEKAARGTKGNLFPWGDGWDPTIANWGEFDVVRTSIPGRVDGYAWSSPPGMYGNKSPFGAEDMAGNVAEWTQSEPGRAVARGGSWASSPFELRTTGRLALTEDTRRADVGFRCAYP